MRLRKQWRLVALVLLVALSAAAIVVPGVGGGADDGDAVGEAVDAPTNVRFGLDLSGGTRIRAPVDGWTAEGVTVPQGESQALAAAIADDLGVDVIDVSVDARGGTVEVYEDVGESAFRAALDARGLDPETVRSGVTERTRTTIVEVIQSKINAAGLSGGTVSTTETARGDHFIIIEVPNQNASAVRNLIAEQGRVTLQASFPAENGTDARREVVLTQEDLAGVSPPETQQGRVVVPVALRDDAAQRFADDMQRYGFTSGQGVGNCDFDAAPNTSYCLLTVRDDRVVYSANMGSGLAGDINSGQFVRDQAFVITASNMTEARGLQINLQAGALPAPLDLGDRGTTYFLSPSLAEQFKLYSLLTGIVAVFAVSFVVFIRYGSPEVAAPMVVTALSEVVILLGFAAAIGLPLDLSHIAGLIAVIGTGVDDLIIIADEVMAEKVRSGRVFKSRFRKALWVIGAAAVTTIIAMSPLAILSLGDLRGFAIITILGVLVGVLLTRPAYGDILRLLLTDR